MKATPSKRAGKDLNITEKVLWEGKVIVKKMVENDEIKQVHGKRLSQNDCRAPQVTGYSKVYKDNVSFIRSHLMKISPKISLQYFVEKLQEWSIQSDEILVSYDVDKLYPSIPI